MGTIRPASRHGILPPAGFVPAEKEEGNIWKIKDKEN